MNFLSRRYNIDLRIIFMITFMFILSACENNNQEKPSVKVVEAYSTTEKTDTNSNQLQSKEEILAIVTPQYYNTYKISIDVNDNTRWITGVERVKYKNIIGQDLKKIYFNLYLNAFGSNSTIKPYTSEVEQAIFKYGKDTGFINIKSVHVNNDKVDFYKNGTILRIDLSQPLKNNEEIEITLQFESYIPKIASRTGGNDKAIWLGNYFPILCEYDDYGWRTDPYYPIGEPFYSQISNYEVKVTAPKEYRVIGTGDEIIKEDGLNNITTLNAEMVRDFAMSISKDYHKKTYKTQNNVNINFYYYNNIHDNDNIFKTAENSINYYSNKFGNYPYKDFDIVEADMFSNSAVSYPGFIMLDSNYAKNSSSINPIIHAVGHQWLYNIIGNDQINEAWLSEGLNSYIQYKILYDDTKIKEKIKSEYSILEDRLKDLDKKKLIYPLSEYTNWDSYYNIQYIKGRFMMYNLNQLMGNEVFDLFLKSYYKKYSFKVAKAEDFINAAEEVYGKDLSYFFDKWLDYDSLPEPEIGGDWFEDSIYIQ